VLAVIGYVTGLLLQGISQHLFEGVLLWWWGGFPSARWLLPDDSRYTAKYKQEVAAAVRSKFGVILDAEARMHCLTERAARMLCGGADLQGGLAQSIGRGRR